jgi:hypothetical protein
MIERIGKQRRNIREWIRDVPGVGWKGNIKIGRIDWVLPRIGEIDGIRKTCGVKRIGKRVGRVVGPRQIKRIRRRGIVYGLADAGARE